MPKEINAGYTIVRRQRVGAVEIVLAHNSKAPEPVCYMETQKRQRLLSRSLLSSIKGRAVMDF